MQTKDKQQKNYINKLEKYFKRTRVVGKGIDDLWQADLVEMGSYDGYNNGYRYLVIVIDTFSLLGCCR